MASSAGVDERLRRPQPTGPARLPGLAPLRDRARPRDEREDGYRVRRAPRPKRENRSGPPPIRRKSVVGIVGTGSPEARAASSGRRRRRRRRRRPPAEASVFLRRVRLVEARGRRAAFGAARGEGEVEGEPRRRVVRVVHRGGERRARLLEGDRLLRREVRVGVGERRRGGAGRGEAHGARVVRAEVRDGPTQDRERELVRARAVRTRAGRALRATRGGAVRGRTAPAGIVVGVGTRTIVPVVVPRAGGVRGASRLGVGTGRGRGRARPVRARHPLPLRAEPSRLDRRGRRPGGAGGGTCAFGGGGVDARPRVRRRRLDGGARVHVTPRLERYVGVDEVRERGSGVIPGGGGPRLHH